MILENSKSLKPSTVKRIAKYLDQFLFGHLHNPIRTSAESILFSIFQIGSIDQKIYLLKQLSKRISNIQASGNASENILALIRKIIPVSKSQSLRGNIKEILAQLSKVLINCFEAMISNKKYEYFRFCQDMIDYGKKFKPQLFELNGCMKCYGQIQNPITPNVRKIQQITEQIKYNANKIYFKLKRIYELRQCIINLVNKNIKPPIIYYSDANGVLVKHGIYHAQQPFVLTTNILQLQFQGIKQGRYTCPFCNIKSEEGSLVCNNCKKGIQVEIKYKMVGGQREKMMQQLSQTSKNLNNHRKKIQGLYNSFQNKTIIKNSQIDIAEIQKIYGQIMLNLYLIGSYNSKQITDGYYINQAKWVCFSCNYIQLQHLFEFFSQFELIECMSSIDQQLTLFIFDHLLNMYYKSTLSIKLQKNIIQAISTIFEIIKTLSPEVIEKVLKIDPKNVNKSVRLLKNIYLKLKQKDKKKIAQRYLNEASSHNLTILQKIELVVAYLVKEQASLLTEVQPKLSQQLKKIKRLQIEDLEPVKLLLDFDKKQYLKLQATNQVLLLLSLLPIQMLPEPTTDILDQEIIPFLNVRRAPQLQKAINIIHSPNQMIPLNQLQNLPKIAKHLQPVQALKLIKQILKFKPVWNFNIFKTIHICDNLLQTLDKEKQLKLCLQGLMDKDQNYFLAKVQNILVPKRKQFIIRVDIPEKEIKNYSRINQEHLDYPMIKQRELKTQDLPGDTMKQVYDWIMQQFKVAMATDLLVEGKIVDDLSVPIEMIYKKLIKNQQKKQIGSSQLDFFKLVYRVRGFFGEPTQQLVGNLGDQQKQRCLSYAPILNQTLQQESICGLDILFRIYQKVIKQKTQRNQSKRLLRIFNMIFKDELVRVKAIERKYVDILIRSTLHFLSSNEEDALQITNSLLETVSKLIDQASLMNTTQQRKGSIGNERKGSQMDIEDDRIVELATKNVKLVLEKISELTDGIKNKHFTELVKLLPFCSKDDPKLSLSLYEYLKPSEAYQQRQKQALETLNVFLQALPENYISFKRIAYQKNMIAVMLQSFNQLVTSVQNISQKFLNQNEFEIITNLQILKGLVKGLADLHQDIYQRDLIPILHKISIAVCKNTKILTYAEQIIKYISRSNLFQNAAKQAKQLIQQHQNEKKKKGQTNKKSKIQEMKQRAKLIKNKFIISESAPKQTIVCAVCHEGYQVRNSLLGLYIYSNKHQIHAIEGWWNQYKRIPATTCVTFFTPIHYECHKRAQEYEAQNHKSEWDGALIRNSEAKCNNWIPFRGSATTDEQFDKVCRKYFEHNKMGTAWTVVNDLKGLLLKFARQQNFAKETKGSALHNSKLIPVLILFAAGLFRKYPDQFKLLLQGVTWLQNKNIDLFQTWALYVTCGLFTIGLENSKAFYENCYKKAVFLCKKQENMEMMRHSYIFLIVIKEIFEKLHSKLEGNQDIITSLESYIPKHYDEIFNNFQNFSQRYRNDIIKRASLAELEQLII